MKKEKKKCGVKKGQYSGDKHPNWKGGQKINKGYMYLHKPKNPMAQKDGYVKRANFVWFEKTGEIIKFPMILHHKNNNPLDDRFENLEKMKQGEHINLTINHALKKFRKVRNKAKQDYNNVVKPAYAEFIKVKEKCEG